MKTIALAFTLALAAGGASAGPARPPVTGVSHIAVYAADASKSEAFYAGQLGAAKRRDAENASGVRYYMSPTQFVEVLPLPADAGKSRLDHIAFATSDAEGLRKYLAAKGVNVPGKTGAGSDGSRYFSVVDPEGNRVEFVQATPAADIPDNPLSTHIIHVGMIVHDRAREDTFYRDILGLRPYWYGGFEEDKPTWVSQQVPDGSDWLEYMLVSPEGTGIPADMSQKTAGVLNHFSLGVADIRVTYTKLWNEQRLEGQGEVPKIGRDAKWQLNLYDPDGTRAEIMELHAIGKPCCSDFTATDPAK